MVYVLLLRGVNVGGKNKVSMSDLKEALSNEALKMLVLISTVGTYSLGVLKALSIVVP